jgi:hypothetical protein
MYSNRTNFNMKYWEIYKKFGIRNVNAKCYHHMCYIHEPHFGVYIVMNTMFISKSPWGKILDCMCRDANLTPKSMHDF